MTKLSGIAYAVFWRCCLFFCVLTGLFHLPLGRRYHVDALPLMGWAGDIRQVVFLHHIAAALFLFCIFFAVVRWAMEYWYLQNIAEEKKPLFRTLRLTLWAKIRVVLFFLLAFSGLLLWWNSLVSFSLSENLYLVVKLAHLACFLVVLTGTVIMTLCRHGRWFKE